MQTYVPSTRHKRPHIRLFFSFFYPNHIAHGDGRSEIKQHQCRKPGARLAGNFVSLHTCQHSTTSSRCQMQGKSMRGPALITAASMSNELRHVFVSCGLCATKRVCGRTQSTHLVSELQRDALGTTRKEATLTIKEAITLQQTR